MKNPWHDVAFGTEAPEMVTAIIEIPKGSKNKYELDKARLIRQPFQRFALPPPTEATVASASCCLG